MQWDSYHNDPIIEKRFYPSLYKDNNIDLVCSTKKYWLLLYCTYKILNKEFRKKINV